MEKKTLQSIITFFGLSAVVSFLALIIFQLKVNQDTTEIIQQHSTLTDNKASQWGAIPGERGVEMQNTFIPFTYDRAKDTFNPSGEYNFDLKQEFKNRTYIQNSPGYIKYLPTYYLQSTSEKPANIEAINILAAQSIYREINSPFMMKGPRYLDIIIKAIEGDFLNYYYLHTIFEFYIKDKALVFATIFKQAKLTPEKQDSIWTDDQFGWQSEETFSAWVTAAYNEAYTQLQERFELTNEQVSILMGAESVIVKMKKLSISALSDGIKQTKMGNCVIPEQCTTWELAIAQWGLGVLTKDQYVPPVVFKQGGYAAFNSSIPDLFEIYLLSDKVIQYDYVRKVLQEDLQADQNFLNFNTMQLVVDNIDNIPLIQYKLGMSEDVGTTELFIDYIKKTQTKLSTKNEALAYQSWRSMDKFIKLGQELLRTGLYGKALFYQTGGQCRRYFEQYPVVCEPTEESDALTQYDFTNNIEAALLWTRIIFNGEDSKKVASDIGIENIQDFIDNGPLAEILTQIKSRFAAFHHCLIPTQCSLQELFLKQWQKGFVTSTYPDLGFKETDKVNGLSQWDIYKDTYGDVSFELSSFYKQTDFDLFNFDMGGILGYYSIWNLYEHYNNEKVPLHPDFKFEGEDAKQIAKYVQKAMLFQFGGQFVKSDAKQYLFDYQNQYTKEKETWSPLQGGVQWKSTSSQLIRSNSDEYFDYATDDDYFQLDTGIKNIENVGRVVKTFMDTKIKAKRVLFYDRKTEFMTTYYYHTGDQVKGSFGLSFKPQTSQKELVLFDIDIYQDVIFKRVSESSLHDFTTAKYRIEDQLIDLEKAEGYPLYVSVGVPPKMNCYSIEGKPCAAYLQKIKQSEIQIEANTGITVSLIKNYFYWLKVDKESPLLTGPIQEEQFIPIALRQVTYQYDQKQMSTQFQDIYDINVQRTAYLWVFLTLGVIFTACTIGSVVYYFKKRNELQNPPLSVYSSFADH